MSQETIKSDLIVFSHIKWVDPLQRLHHLVHRYAEDRRIFFVERPQVVDNLNAHLEIEDRGSIAIVTPYIPSLLKTSEKHDEIRSLLDELIEDEKIHQFHLWYSDAVAYKYSHHLVPTLLIYDGFSATKTEDHELEKSLIDRADLILCDQSDRAIKSWEQDFETVRNLERWALRNKIQQFVHMSTL
ncbi:MAG TPA: hypothetical protein VF412_18920 [Bdellovibrio sp.]|uniref:hypothetical protein n=1 Tax=Bdellovibrio sp. TaxID=28201 RepID=UPI002EF80AE5